MKYNTETKNYINNFLKNNSDKCRSMNELLLSINGTSNVVSKATLYRVVDDLLSRGLVKKYIVCGEACYQYVEKGCHEHYHFVCERCKTVIHLDCDCITNMINHVSNEHNLNVNSSSITLYGICDKCKGE